MMQKDHLSLPHTSLEKVRWKESPCLGVDALCNTLLLIPSALVDFWILLGDK